MAREASISYEQVAAAADKIKAAGGKATTRAVRNAIGAGSMLTIGNYLRAYKAGLPQPAHLIGESVDPAVARAIDLQIAVKVQEATAALTASLAKLQVGHDALLNEEERRAAVLSEALEAHAALAAEHAALQGRTLQLDSQNSHLAAELKDQRTQLEEAKVALVTARLRLEAVPRIEEEMEKLRAGSESARAQVAAQLEQALAEAARQREEAAVAKAKLEGEISLRLSLAAAMADLASLRDAAIEAAKNSTAEAARLRRQLGDRAG